MTPSYVQRVSRRRVQTSMLRFLHPRTGRVVTLAGTFHFGTAGYFTGLREAIDKLEADGAVVHCEGSNRTPADDADICGDERAILEQLSRGSDLAARRVRELGWTDQITGLGRPDSWQRVDLSNLEIIRGLGLPVAARLAAAKLAEVDWPDTNRTGHNRLHLVFSLLLRFMTTDKRIIKTANSSPTDEVLVTARNEHALTAVADTDQDLVLVWGLAHLPGLEAGLTALGFRRDGAPQWHTVTTRRPSLPGALWRLSTRRRPPTKPRL